MSQAEQKYIKLISGESRGLFADLGRSALRFASWAFEGGARIRRRAYDGGWSKSVKVEIPVISLGNLTTGGTGKTPWVSWLASYLMSKQRRVAVLSRGYRAEPGCLNDEGQWLKTVLPELEIFQHSKRAQSAQRAVTEGFDVALMDDGFQHRALARDLDILLIDAARPFGFGALLPRGLLREPISSCQRADVVLLTRCELASDEQIAAIEETLKAHGAPSEIYRTEFRPACVNSVCDLTRRESDLEALKSGRYGAACGIGNPESFRALLEQRMALELAFFEVFADHQSYRLEDIEALMKRAENTEAVLVTEKDAVKMAGLIEAGGDYATRLLAVGIEPVFRSSQDQQRFCERIDSLIEAKAKL